jgi:repressor LexA
MENITTRQRRILEFIRDTVQARGYPPTVREIGEAVGLASPSTVHAHLAKLEESGRIRRDPTKPRAMHVCADVGAEPRRPSVEALPLVGSVAAGLPRLAEQDVEDWIATPFKGDFVLRVVGDSMIDAGILPGDLVSVRRAPRADEGEIVVALIEDEATVKRLSLREGRVMLMPENPAYAPILADEVTILGVVTGVMREL